MTRTLFKSLCFLNVFFLVSTVSAEKVSTESVALNLLNWDEYISDSVLEKFKAETGISVNVVHYERRQPG